MRIFRVRYVAGEGPAVVEMTRPSREWSAGMKDYLRNLNLAGLMRNTTIDDLNAMFPPTHRSYFDAVFNPPCPWCGQPRRFHG